MAVNLFIRPTRGTRPKVLSHPRAVVTDTARVYPVITYRTQAISSFVPSITCTWAQLAGSSAPWRVRGTFLVAVRYHALLVAPTTYAITPPAGKRTPRILSVTAENTTAPTYVDLEIDEPFGGEYGVEILAVEALPP